MKYLITVFVISFVLAITKAECGSKTLECVDCNTFKICVGNDETTSTCPSLQRYCTTGIANDFCSSIFQPGNLACNSVTQNFKCTRPGYFPSPYNCTEYFECFFSEVEENKKELIFFKKTCGDKQYYSSKQKTCVAQASVQCNRVSCGSTNLGFFPYTGDTQYYHFCAEDNAANDVLMFRCDEVETFTNVNGCRFNCPGIGRYAHEDKTKYYECKAVGDGNYTIEKCWSGVYDPVTKKCNFVY